MCSQGSQKFTIDQTIIDLKTGIANQSNLTSLDNLAICLNEQFENHIINSTPNSEFINEISRKVLASKKNIFVKIKWFFNSLYMCFSYLLNSEDESKKNIVLERIYNFLKSIELPDYENLIDIQVKDYLHELNSLQDTLVYVQDLSNKLTSKNESQTTDIEEKNQEINILIENFDQKNDSQEKLETYLKFQKDEFCKLNERIFNDFESFKGFESEKVRKTACDLQNKYKTYFNQFFKDDMNALRSSIESLRTQECNNTQNISMVSNSNTHMSERETIWQEIEKSHERYEKLLDFYQRVIKDKELYIKKLEGEIIFVKKDKSSIEDQQYSFSHEKEQTISALELELNELKNKLRSKNSEFSHKFDSIQSENQRLKTAIDEFNPYNDSWEGAEKKSMQEKVKNFETKLKIEFKSKLAHFGPKKICLVNFANFQRFFIQKFLLNFFSNFGLNQGKYLAS